MYRIVHGTTRNLPDVTTFIEILNTLGRLPIADIAAICDVYPASLRRAARWDGWLADSADPTGMTLSPEDIARGVATIGRSDDYDVVVLGDRERGDPVAYGQAGATWWLESLHDQRGSIDDALELVSAGPPV